MAAYNYDSQDTRHPTLPPSYDNGPLSPDPFNRLPSSQTYTGASASPTPIHPDHDPYYARYSQNSLASDNGAYPIEGRRDDSDQYAENIPLQQRPDWMQQPTHYPPSLEAQQNMGPPASSRGRRKRTGFFKKKLAWVTYILTTAQVAVFIAELVRNGKADTLYNAAGISTNSCSSTDRIPDYDQTNLQSNDRSLTVCPDQHGCSLHSVHEERGRTAKQRQGRPLALSQLHHQ